MNDKTVKEKIKVLEKLIYEGYDTDKKILDIKIEDLLLLNNFTRTDLNIASGMKRALSNRSLISYICSSKINLSKE